MVITLVIALSVGLILVGGGYAVWRNIRAIRETNQKIAWASRRHYTLLKVMVPRNNEKTPFAAEQMFAALHGIYQKGAVMQEHFSFEIAANTHSINFFMLVPTHLRDFIEGQVYAQYPTVEIDPVSDYAKIATSDMYVVGAEIALTKPDIFPFRTFVNFDVDPLAGITGVLSKMGDGETLAIQIVVSPTDGSWEKEGTDYVKKVRAGKPVGSLEPLGVAMTKAGVTFLQDIASDMWKATTTTAKKDDKKTDDKAKKEEIRLTGPQEVAMKGIESKITKLGYWVTVRVLAITANELLSNARVTAVAGAFKQFNLTNLNSFEVGELRGDPEFLRAFRSRSLSARPYRLNVEEIASVAHFPDTSVQTPNVSWAGSKKGEPPQNLPIENEVATRELTTFGLTSFRNRRSKFGIKLEDRLLHFYIIGKTGTGKSTLIENMIYDDIREGRGVTVIDPHGELIDHILNFVPDERVNDVVYFAPDDRGYPLAFNLLENVEGDMRNIVASGLMSIFTKLWANVWSARMEYILRNAILAALEVPNATLLSIMRILNDATYRKYALSHVSDPVVKDFFVNEFDRYDPKFRQEAIAPIQNKVGQFLSSSTIRNIVGQPHSTFSISDIMTRGKIFLVDLSVGKIGEDNSKLLGSMMITKIQLAAMERAWVAPEKRSHYFLYVDEFQNFATESFATVLSEARKYRLGLTLANQYVAQIPEVVADAIFGNVGTMISFRVGAEDADRLVKQYEPAFDANDLINLPNRQIYVKMAIDGVTSQAFSAHTLPPMGIVSDNTKAIIAQSRQKYARERGVVEEAINQATLTEFRAQIDQDHDLVRETRPLVLGETLYKEFSAKGGEQWYFGQPPEALADELMKLADGKSSESGHLGGDDKASDVGKNTISPDPSQAASSLESPEKTLIKPDTESKTAIVASAGDIPGRLAKTLNATTALTQSATDDAVNFSPHRPRHDPPHPEGEQGSATAVATTQERSAAISPRGTVNRGQQADDWLPLEEL